MAIVRRVKWAGSNAWLVDSRAIDDRRRFFPTKEQAEAHAADIDHQVRVGGRAWLSLDAAARAELLQVWNEARNAGVSLRQVWEDWRRQGPALERKTVGEAVEEFGRVKAAAGRRQTYQEALSQALRHWCRGFSELALRDLKTGHVEPWVNDARAAHTKATRLARLRGFFSWAKRRSYIAHDPCEAIESVSIEHKTPMTLTPEEAHRWLAWTAENAKEFLPTVAAGLFLGLRPAEVERMNWSALDFEAGLCIVEAAATKVRQRRVLRINQTAAAWLEPLKRKPDQTIGLTRSSATRRRRDLRAALKTPWPADVLRHTCASNRVAIESDLALVAKELGHSVPVLLRHYRALIMPAAAQRFWDLRPNQKMLVPA